MRRTIQQAMVRLGFEPHRTSDNRQAYRKLLADGGEILVAAGEAWLPEDPDEPVFVCRYGPNGEPVGDNGTEFPDLHVALQALGRFEPIPEYEGEVTGEAAVAWLDRVVGRLGDRFHPDLPAGQYEPPLPDFEALNLDDGLRHLFDRLGPDVYVLSSAARERWAESQDPELLVRFV